MEIEAFRGWRYKTGPGGDASKLIAPPYDVLSGDDKKRLLAQDEHNIVAVDMPHVPPSSLGPDEVYQAAAERLRRWQSAGLLVQDDAPAVYVYRQDFDWAGKTHRRMSLVCGVRATPLGQDVIPHEHTFAGPKADRLRLMQCTAIQLSPVLGVCRDPSGRASELLAKVASAKPDAHGQLGAVKEALWVVRDRKTIDELAAALRGEPVFIADGHHRYTTALNYRDGLAGGGELPADHEANFVMFALVPREDPGLLILPTHRIIRGLSQSFSVADLAVAAEEFSWRKCTLDAATFDPAKSLAASGTGAMAFLAPGGKELWIARLTDPAAMRQAAPDQVEAWRSLDVSILHTLLLDRHMKPWWTADTTISYTPKVADVLDACRAAPPALGVCLQATRFQQVEEIALAGATMPHKSTYFYPKLATGWVLKPLA